MIKFTFTLFLLFFLKLQAAEYAVFGDAGQQPERLQKLKNSILQEKVTSVVLLGDQIYDVRNTYNQVWDDFKKAGLTFDIMALGNHLRSYAEEIEYFSSPGEFYTKEFFDDVFIVLNSDNTRNIFTQMRFLYSELQKFEDTKKNVFIVFHHPLGTISKFHDWGERWLFQLCFPFVTWNFRSRITALLVGHDHFSGFYTSNQMPMLLAGGAVDLRSGQYNFTWPSQVTREYLNDTHRLWVKLVTGSQKASFHFIDIESQQTLFTKEIIKK